MLETYLNIHIVVFGLLSAYLATKTDNDLRAIGFGVSISNQPVWFALSAMAGQWGMAFLSFVYLYLSYRGFKNHNGVERCKSMITNLIQRRTISQQYGTLSSRTLKKGTKSVSKDTEQDYNPETAGML